MRTLDHPIRPAITFARACVHLADQEVEGALTTLIQTVGISAPCTITHLSEISAAEAGIDDTCYVRLGDIGGQDALWIFLRTCSDKFFRVLLRIAKTGQNISSVKRELQRRNEAIQRALFTFFDRSTDEEAEEVFAPPEAQPEEPVRVCRNTRRPVVVSDELCAHIIRALVRNKAHNGVVVPKGIGGVLKRLDMPECGERSAVSLGHVFRACISRGYFAHTSGSQRVCRVTVKGIRLVLTTLGEDAFSGVREGYVTKTVNHVIAATSGHMESPGPAPAPHAQGEEDEYVLREKHQGHRSRTERHTHALEAVEALLLSTVRALKDSANAESFADGVRALFLLTLQGVRHPGTVTRSNIDRTRFAGLPNLVVEQVLAFLDEE